MNQFDAAFANFIVFSRNLLPLLDDAGAQQMKVIQQSFPAAARSQMQRSVAAKMGIPHTHANIDTLVKGFAAPHFTTQNLFHFVNAAASTSCTSGVPTGRCSGGN